MSKTILFDGYCNLCTATVNFILKHDKNNLYTLIPLQSDEGQGYLKKYNLPTNNFDTVILIESDKVYTKSTAVLKIMKNLSGTIKYIYLFIIIPRFLRDFIYTIIAKSRFILFGRSKTCSIYENKK